MSPYNSKFRIKDLYQFNRYKFCDSFVEDGHILIVLKRTSKTGKCPVCEKRCNNIHKRRLRKIRDLDIVQSKVFIEFTQYDICCSCGYDGVEELDFVESYSRYSKRFEEKVFILCTKMCIKDVAKEMRIGWEATKNIDKEYAKKYLVDLDKISPKQIGVDEVAYEKGHKYITVVRDVDLGKVIWTGKDRKKETLNTFFSKLGIEKCQEIVSAVVDMWDPFISSIQENTKAQIIFDKFHIAKKINEALDKVRRNEFSKADSLERKNMKHKRFLILSRRKNLELDKKEILAQLLEQNENLYTAYILKEQILDIFDETDCRTGIKRFEKWFENVFQSGLNQFDDVVKTIKNYFYGIINYFNNRLTNAQSEGFNNKINVIRRRAYGFRDLDYFMLKIVQACGLNNQNIP